MPKIRPSDDDSSRDPEREQHRMDNAAREAVVIFFDYCLKKLLSHYEGVFSTMVSRSVESAWEKLSVEIENDWYLDKNGRAALEDLKGELAQLKQSVHKHFSEKMGNREIRELSSLLVRILGAAILANLETNKANFSSAALNVLQNDGQRWENDLENDLFQFFQGGLSRDPLFLTQGLGTLLNAFQLPNRLSAWVNSQTVMEEQPRNRWEKRPGWMGGKTETIVVKARTTPEKLWFLTGEDGFRLARDGNSTLLGDWEKEAGIFNAKMNQFGQEEQLTLQEIDNVIHLLDVLASESGDDTAHIVISRRSWNQVFRELNPQLPESQDFLKIVRLRDKLVEFTRRLGSVDWKSMANQEPLLATSVGFLTEASSRLPLELTAIFTGSSEEIMALWSQIENEVLEILLRLETLDLEAIAVEVLRKKQNEFFAKNKTKYEKEMSSVIYNLMDYEERYTNSHNLLKDSFVTPEFFKSFIETLAAASEPIPLHDVFREKLKEVLVEKSFSKTKTQKNLDAAKDANLSWLGELVKAYKSLPSSVVGEGVVNLFEDLSQLREEIQGIQDLLSGSANTGAQVKDSDPLR